MPVLASKPQHYPGPSVGDAGGKHFVRFATRINASMQQASSTLPAPDSNLVHI
jgi:hypothetical protein